MSEKYNFACMDHIPGPVAEQYIAHVVQGRQHRVYTVQSIYFATFKTLILIVGCIILIKQGH